MQPASAEQRGHEPTTISLRGIIISAVVLIVAAVIIHIALWVMYVAVLRHDERQDISPSAVVRDLPAPPEPRLQPFEGHGLPEQDLARMHKAENDELERRGWTVNREMNIAKIPDELAEKIALRMSAPRQTSATTQQTSK